VQDQPCAGAWELRLLRVTTVYSSSFATPSVRIYYYFLPAADDQEERSLFFSGKDVGLFSGGPNNHMYDARMLYEANAYRYKSDISIETLYLQLSHRYQCWRSAHSPEPSQYAPLVTLQVYTTVLHEFVRMQVFLAALPSLLSLPIWYKFTKSCTLTGYWRTRVRGVVGWCLLSLPLVLTLSALRAYSLCPSQELNRDAFISSCDVCPTCSVAPDSLVIDGTDIWVKRNKLPEGFERCVPLCEYLFEGHNSKSLYEYQFAL
jgi:hypothetical protein